MDIKYVKNIPLHAPLNLQPPPPCNDMTSWKQ